MQTFEYNDSLNVNLITPLPLGGLVHALFFKGLSCLPNGTQLVRCVLDLDKRNGQTHLENNKLEVTPLNIEPNNAPLIGIGLESIFALLFAAGMFTLTLLRPVLDLWLPF